MGFDWVFAVDAVDWDQLSELLRIAPLHDTPPSVLRVRFSNSRYVCFVYDGAKLVGAGRALADGNDCFYVADVVVHPEYQNSGLGKAIMLWFMERSAGHQKIILYAAPGKEGFYHRLGFRRMKTAMARFEDQQAQIDRGIIEP